jgi:hypothetical protein
MLNEFFWPSTHYCAKFVSMKMRAISLVFVLVIAAAPAAMAYDKYIPLGTGYSPDVDSLPAFNSDAGQVSEQTDVYETELYFENRKKALDDSRMREFFSDRNSTGSDSHIDY